MSAYLQEVYSILPNLGYGRNLRGWQDIRSHFLRPNLWTLEHIGNGLECQIDLHIAKFQVHLIELEAMFRGSVILHVLIDCLTCFSTRDLMTKCLIFVGFPIASRLGRAFVKLCPQMRHHPIHSTKDILEQRH
jgi:hypothetical protein